LKTAWGTRLSGGKDAVKERLNESGQEEVLALIAFKCDAERFLESGFDAVECGKRMRGGSGASFASVGGEQPGNVLWLFQRDLTGHHAH
jgi:hypothetical protein